MGRGGAATGARGYASTKPKPRTSDLLARWPGLADTWFNLAVVQRKAGRFEAALASYQQALAHGVSQPEEVHLNRGVIYSDCLRRDDAAARGTACRAVAQSSLRTRVAQSRQPAAKTLGGATEALALYERALAIDPRCHVALARHASLTTATGPDAAGRRSAASKPCTLPGVSASGSGQPGLRPRNRAGEGRRRTTRPSRPSIEANRQSRAQLPGLACAAL